MNLWELERHLRKWKKFTSSLSYHIHWLKEILPESEYEKYYKILEDLITQLNYKMTEICKQWPEI